MKRYLALCISLCLLLCTCTMSFATEITNNGQQSADVPVTYGVSSEYTISIPSKLTISSQNNRVMCTFSVEGRLAPNEMLTMNIVSKNYDNGHFYLINSMDSKVRLEYLISDSGTYIKSGDTVMKLDAQTLANEEVYTKQLGLMVNGTPTVAGEYSDIITVNVGLQSLEWCPEGHYVEYLESCCYLCPIHCYQTYTCDKCGELPGYCVSLMCFREDGYYRVCDKCCTCD